MIFKIFKYVTEQQKVSDTETNNNENVSKKEENPEDEDLLTSLHQITWREMRSRASLSCIIR